jgi:Putative zinc-finger
MNCSTVTAIAPDLALGMLSGDERGEALAHLDSCRRCRDTVEKLSTTVDAMSLLAPLADPEPGFEERVLGRIDFKDRRRAKLRPAILVAAAAVVVVGALFVVGALWLRDGGSSNDQIAAYTMRTPNGRVVGEAYMHGGDSTWVFVDVPKWSEGGAGSAAEYALRVTTDDGRSIVMPGNFSGGHGGWGTRVAVDSKDVRELALVDSTGRVWCSATVPV